MKVLFVCNQGENRSKTAAELFKDKFETKSAGLFNGLSINEMNWADAIVVMESFQKDELIKKFTEQCFSKRVLCFDIPDIYKYNQEELISILKSKDLSIL